MIRPAEHGPAAQQQASTGDELLASLAAGLHRHVLERRRAEQRLADFAFREAGPGDLGLGPVDWRYFTAHALRTALEPSALGLLERLRKESARPEELGTLLGSADLAAVADRIGGLAAAGLAARELESGLVSLTALGEAVLSLLDEVEDRVRREEAAS